MDSKVHKNLATAVFLCFGAILDRKVPFYFHVSEILDPPHQHYYEVPLYIHYTKKLRIFISVTFFL